MGTAIPLEHNPTSLFNPYNTSEHINSRARLKFYRTLTLCMSLKSKTPPNTAALRTREVLTGQPSVVDLRLSDVIYATRSRNLCKWNGELKLNTL